MNGKFTIKNGVLKKYEGEDEELIIPDGIEEIQHGAFSGNKTIKKVIIPEGVKTLGEYCFSCKKTLEEVILPSTLERIGDYAFADCYALRSLEVPKSVSYIGAGVFPAHRPEQEHRFSENDPEILAAFTGVNVSPDNPNFMSEKGALYSKDRSVLYYVPDNYSDKKFIIPKSVREIRTHAFYKNRNIEEITFEGTVDKFGVHSFENCEKLKSVRFFKDQTRIVSEDAGSDTTRHGNRATVEHIGIFEDCSNLKKVILPDNLEIIGDGTFEDCAISEITFPDTLTEIGNKAFCGNGIKEAALPKSLNKIGGHIFGASLEKVTLYDSIEDHDEYCEFETFFDVLEIRSNIGRLGLPYFVLGTLGHDEAVWGGFEVTVLSSADDSVKYKVYMPSSKSWGMFQLFMEAWDKHAVFDFSETDDVFATMKENKLQYAAERLRHIDELSEELKDKFVKYIKRFSKDFLPTCTKEDIEYFAQFGIGEKKTASKKTSAKKIDGYKKVDGKKFKTENALDENLSLNFCEFRFRGYASEIKKLTDFIAENNIGSYYKEEVGDDIVEVRINADAPTTALVQEFPTLKVTGLCEDLSHSEVLVLFSDCGYSVFNKKAFGGYFDKRHDGGDGRWAFEHDMMKSFTVKFTWLRTGERQTVKYSYPFKAEWDKNEYLIEIDGEFYKKTT